MLNRLRTKVRQALPGAVTYAPEDLNQVPDDLPPSSLAAPLQVARLVAEWDTEHDRAEFRVVVRDADGQRCPNIAVEATVTGPTRSASDEITTDLMGAARFRMADGPGNYAFEVKDVGARGITWDPTAGAGTKATLEA